MSPYLAIGALVAILALVAASPRFEKGAYALCFLLLTGFLTFRFGQGTDWLGYNYIFASAPSSIDFGSSFYGEAVHSEFGWKLLNNVLKALGVDFVFLSISLSLVEMLLLNRFLGRYSPNRVLSLLVSFPAVYLTYFFSAMRQGLVIALFLGIMVELLERKKTGAYLVLLVFATQIHSLAVVLLMPPLFLRMKFKTIASCLGLCVLLGCALVPILPAIFNALGLNYSGNGISITAVAYRVFMAFVIYMLYSSSREKIKSEGLDLLLKIYLGGLSVYFLFMGNDLVASRFASPLLAVEMVLIPILVTRGGRSVTALLLVIVLAVGFMAVKNIDAYIEQGSYRLGVTAINYPYISIFNSDDIYEYRSDPLLAYVQT